MTMISSYLLTLFLILGFHCDTGFTEIRSQNQLQCCPLDNTTCSLTQHRPKPRNIYYYKHRQKSDTEVSSRPWSQYHTYTDTTCPRSNLPQLTTYRQLLLSSLTMGHKSKVCREKEHGADSGKVDKVTRSLDQDILKLLNEKEAEGWKKNFAGLECGAKLIKSSDSLKHPQNLISKNQDEYMLTECKDSTFFTIELCETIKVMRFEIDNFELYSGTVRNFTVRTVDKYSNNLKDWIVIGNFEASSYKMEMQTFSDFDLKAFGKFIRVDINSHYGTEHYCTMTSFRVFGITEYEFLHLLDNEADDSTENITEQDEPVTPSDVQNRLNEMVITKPGPTVTSKEQTSLFTYKYFFLQMRSDVCIDSLTLETFTQHGIATGKGDIKSVDYGALGKVTHANSRGPDIGDIAIKDSVGDKKEAVITKSDQINASGTVLAPKESILVQISNRVKSLEKNLTIQNNILKAFNTSTKQQGNDINKILETILKAKEVFEETTLDTEGIKKEVKKMDHRMGQIENVLAESTETLKMMMAVSIVLAITCLFLISIICFSPTSHFVVCENDEDELTVDELTAENSQINRNTTVSDIAQDESSEINSPKLKKKVTFSEEELSKESSDEDVTLLINRSYKRLKKKETKRRVTWCGGGLRKLAEDAASLVAKEL